MRAKVLLSALVLVACRGGSPGDALPSAGESPQAKAEPAPLENVAPTASALPATPDSGPPPSPLRGDVEVAADPPPKDAVVIELEATLRAAEIPPAFRGPETSIVAIDAAKKKTEPRLTIDLGASRARVVLASAGFVLPEGTELRARADRYGHFVLLPDASRYRIAAPGSLHALLGERRIDVAPLLPVTVTDRGDGAHRLGYRTRRVEVANRAATATFEIARVADAGEGGELLCRALLDLMNAPPGAPVCALEDVPLHVEWRWAGKGGLTFDASRIVRRSDLGASLLAAPPPGASFALPSLPEIGAVALVDGPELVAFRTAPADIPSATPLRGSGLTLSNAGDQLRLAWLDGAAIAWVAPGGQVAFPQLLRGRYGFAWRTFLGDAYDAPTTITVPCAQVSGATDAGAAP